MMREVLNDRYKSISDSLSIDDSKDKRISFCIHQLLQRFMMDHQRVAVYCNGYHTKMLMTDYVADIRDIYCVIDNGKTGDDGLLVIKDEEIEKCGIDGVILSSFKHRQELKTLMRTKHNRIDVLDIYDGLKEYGIFLNSEFYSTGPYYKYNNINGINNSANAEEIGLLDALRELLKCYVEIKDFRMAIEVLESIVEMTKNKDDEDLLHDLVELYDLQIEALSNCGRNNVLIMCMDGMRYSDYKNGLMNRSKQILDRRGRLFSRAYSYSTMTFESLVPAFSENTDQRTEYYKSDDVDAEKCRFCKKALEQNRKIYIYGDGYNYITGDALIHIGHPQTFSEKLWDFTVDSCDEDNGLFYLHELYETHYSYPNPYTKGKMVSCGTAMLFDYLPKNGGELQTDYTAQLYDSLKYVDDTLAPFLDVLQCSILLFADHGNLLLKQGDKLNDIKPLQLTAAEEWIRIPWCMVSPSIEIGEDDSLVSLLDINDAVISLLENKEFCPDKERRFVKVGRSEIYNPDFKELYRMLGLCYAGEAFEGFIFDDGFKLLVYSNGRKEIYGPDDEYIDDPRLLDERFEEIYCNISVLR